ncbi:MAG: hypothetical protein H0T88_00630 [Lysobacter sp.]|nr:hypothetical protein [Lysobacter sp.]
MQLTNTAAGAAGAASAVRDPPREQPSLGDAEPVDVSVDRNLDAQSERERPQQEAPDLLQHPAPKE